MTEHIGTVEFRRQVSPKQYETAEMKVTVNVYADSLADVEHALNLAAIEAKTFVYGQLGIETEEVDGIILEKAVEKVKGAFTPSDNGRRPPRTYKGGSGGSDGPPHKFAKKGSKEAREQAEWAVNAFLSNPDDFFVNFNQDNWAPNKPALKHKATDTPVWLDDEYLTRIS